LGKEFHEQREFSEHTAQVIDEEVARILHTAAEKASDMLAEHRDLLDKLAKQLVEREMLDDKDIEALIGPSPNRNPSPNGQLVAGVDSVATPAADAAAGS
jgi:cell division protease FtsH